ncbi:hypothetical protein HRH59_10705 [Rheinheimera sp. YQF-2]|uniref:Uncharacterized protein n=1 Tax=Rheinheimera lutimaris TaxID=2740584 RepID=A0A7Y5EIQ3_9GAMM|nr:hypothetical protein [Rheinheimera lutimaris]NRQ43022.1 hypothetical protein [Rheinheimera lutimaris]
MFYQFFIDANEKDNKVSARGLMVIFVLGVVPIILGIDLNEIQFELSWLKQFEITHKERFSLIYAALIFYSLYRFQLVNKETKKTSQLKSLGWFITNKYVGHLFVKRFIFRADQFNGVYVDKRSEDLKVVVNANYDSYEPHMKADTFSLLHNNYGELCAQVRRSEDVSLKSLGISELWDIQLDPDCYPFDGQQVVSDLAVIKSFKLRVLLGLAEFVFSFKSMTKDVSSLDYYLPIYCNTGLALYLIIHYLAI